MGAVNRLEDLHVDRTGTFTSAAASVTAVQDWIRIAIQQLDRDGYLVMEDVLAQKACAAIAAELTALLGPTGRNTFEGTRTRRIYSLLTKTRICDEVVEHPRVLALLDQLLMPNYLLSQLQAISIGPGQTSQLLHFDDGMYPLRRPRPALSVAAIWAISEFTNDNGATVLIPGSHHWNDDRRPTAADELVSIEMPAGSVVVFLGTLWHGGGANSTDRARLALTAQYCQPWLRPQEAFALSTPPTTAATLSENIRRMLGYSIHPPFLGMVDGMHPKRVLPVL
ncbi:phytanoyl-CoA dioxygenase family protein [Mycobacterium sp. AMU20-3851]|uniref:phytanoyl-CoA dioxygenase family protein n=1 Tax=Mycobacterium sp. AMU20-3851 TaxID=3122055 RepID=UPI0037541AA5